eukprot:2544316-Rhodomonas_salina.1
MFRVRISLLPLAGAVRLRTFRPRLAGDLRSLIHPLTGVHLPLALRQWVSGRADSVSRMLASIRVSAFGLVTKCHLSVRSRGTGKIVSPRR